VKWSFISTTSGSNSWSENTALVGESVPPTRHLDWLRSFKMRPLIGRCLAFVVLTFSLGGSADRALPADPPGKDGKGVAPVWIYRNVPEAGEKDTREETERLFAPYGFMPEARAAQISVNASAPLDPKDATKGSVIEYTFSFKKPDDWMGAYSLLEGGTAWGTKPGLNIRGLLKLPADAEVACRFRARGAAGGEAVTFQCGGVTAGEHRSSLRFPVKAAPNPLKLTKDFKEYTIKLKAADLTNIVDPFCVVAVASDNRGKESITIHVDDIRFEPAAKPKATTLPAGWQERLAKTLWICYTPTGFDPTAKPAKKPTADDIRADLAAVRALADKVGVKGNKAGIITYGCRDGLEEIAPLAKEAELSVILGVFNPNDEDEVRNAEKLIERDDLKQTIAACCVGNEAITFRRATLDDVRRVATQLRGVRGVPMTTTEIVQAYGDKELFKAPIDFTFCNAHALFSDVPTTAKGAKWACERLKDVLETAPKGHLVLAKELGWPAGPVPFDAKQQAAYWKAVFADPVTRRVNVCIFDGFQNVPWKKEMVAVPGVAEKVDIGPHWPVLFDEDRKPTPFAEDLLRLWKQSR
jgi:exo-beta-1,3-glucanase (GH17 family)